MFDRVQKTPLTEIIKLLLNEINNSDVFRGYRKRPVTWNGLNPRTTTKKKLLKCNLGSFIYYIHKIFRKTKFVNPLICTRTCAYHGVRNVSFSENFCVSTKWMNPFVMLTTLQLSVNEFFHVCLRIHELDGNFIQTNNTKHLFTIKVYL